MPVFSMQGNCSSTTVPQQMLDKTTGAPLMKLEAQQCVILAHDHLLPVGGAEIWISNLFLRYALRSEEQNDFKDMAQTYI